MTTQIVCKHLCERGRVHIVISEWERLMKMANNKKGAIYSDIDFIDICWQKKEKECA